MAIEHKVLRHSIRNMFPTFHSGEILSGLAVFRIRFSRHQFGSPFADIDSLLSSALLHLEDSAGNSTQHIRL
jgi:hypothetical protein